MYEFLEYLKTNESKFDKKHEEMLSDFQTMVVNKIKKKELLDVKYFFI